MAGLAITFDDAHIDEWYKYRSLFNEYKFKGTFFVSKPMDLNKSQIDKLKKLNYDGSEIGCHGLNHISLKEYLEKNKDYSEYLEDEISPAFNILDNYGFEIKSFAYPKGYRDKIADNLLSKIFKKIRGIADFSESYKCYSDSKKSLKFALPLDNIYEPNDSILIKYIDYAIKKNLTLITFSHNITKDDTAQGYSTPLCRLIKIFNYVKENNLKFYNFCKT